MTYYLFIDDQRDLHFEECHLDLDLPWIVARSTREAKAIVMKKGCLPTRMALDHDLGVDMVSGKEDTIMDFLKWLVQYSDTDDYTVPEYSVHTANPVGYRNICSFMNSWHKSRTL